MIKLDKPNLKSNQWAWIIGLILIIVVLVLSFTVITISRQHKDSNKPKTAAQLYHAKDYDKALDLVNKDIAKRPDSASDYNFSGNIYRDKGQTDLAIKNYTKSIELNKSYLPPRSNLASLLINLGKKDDAKKVIDDGLVAFPAAKVLTQLQAQL